MKDPLYRQQEEHSWKILYFRDLKRLPGDKTYCNKFRKDAPYGEDTWFLDIVDLAVFDYMMSHLDEKHAYYRPLKEEKPLFNVMFDFGHA